MLAVTVEGTTAVLIVNVTDVFPTGIETVDGSVAALLSDRKVTTSGVPVIGSATETVPVELNPA